MKTSLLAAAVVAVSMVSLPAFASDPGHSSGSQLTAHTMGSTTGSPRPMPTHRPTPSPRPNPGPRY